MNQAPNNLTELVNHIIGILNPLIVVIAGLALLAFFWGLAKFISKAGDAKSHADGKNLMIWGIVALFLMVSFLSIIQFFQSDLGFEWRGIPLFKPSSTP
jgi:phosphate starvation-inducible membrane PsiE